MAYPTATLQVGQVMPGWIGSAPIDPLPLQADEDGRMVATVYYKFGDNKENLLDCFGCYYARLAITIAGWVDYLLVTVDQSLEWTAIPYALGMLKEGDRFVPTNGSYRLIILLVDNDTGIISGRRELMLSPRMSKLFRDLAGYQEEFASTFTEAGYHKAILKASSLWPTTIEMLAGAHLMESVPENGWDDPSDGESIPDQKMEVVQEPEAPPINDNDNVMLDRKIAAIHKLS